MHVRYRACSEIPRNFGHVAVFSRAERNFGQDARCRKFGISSGLPLQPVKVRASHFLQPQTRFVIVQVRKALRGSISIGLHFAEFGFERIALEGS